MKDTVSWRCSVNKVFLEILQNSQENTCTNFIKKETLEQVFSFEFCKISMNTFSYRTLPVATSVMENIATFSGFKILLYCCLLTKSCRLKACSFIKKSPWHWRFPVHLAKFFRITFFEKHLREIESTQQRFTCSKSTIKTLEKCLNKFNLFF